MTIFNSIFELAFYLKCSWQTEIIMSYKKRYDVERKFWLHLQRDFVIDKAPKTLFPDGFQETDVDIFHIRRKPAAQNKEERH